ncbi:MAG: GAF domain-containing protein [Armatimonadota bacterium]
MIPVLFDIISIVMLALSIFTAFRLTRNSQRRMGWVLVVLLAVLILLVAFDLPASVRAEVLPRLVILIASALILAVLIGSTREVEGDGELSKAKENEESLRKLNRTLEMLSDVNQAVIRADSESELIDRTCRIIAEMGGYPMVWIGYLEGKDLHPVAHAGCRDEYPDLGSLAADEAAPVWKAIQSGKWVFGRDLETDPDFAAHREEALRCGYRSTMSFPLVTDSRLMGALSIYSGQENAFDEEETRLLAELAGDLAYGISALRTREERRRAEESAHRAEEREKEFYRSMIEASTEGKLIIADRREIMEIAGPALAAWKIDDASELSMMRNALGEIAASEGMEESRVYDFKLAAGEAAANAVKHGGGGSASVHRMPDGMMFVVTDKGGGIDTMNLPKVALLRGYTTAVSLGMGYKAMIAVADRVFLHTGPEGTTVGILMHFKAELPELPGMF